MCRNIELRIKDIYQFHYFLKYPILFTQRKNLIIIINHPFLFINENYQLSSVFTKAPKSKKLIFQETQKTLAIRKYCIKFIVFELI
jgi:hypothetical protein